MKQPDVDRTMRMLPFVGRVCALVTEARAILKDAKGSGLVFPCAVLSAAVTSQDDVRPGVVDLTHAAAAARATAVTAATHSDSAFLRLALALADACLALSYVQEAEPEIAETILALAERELGIAKAQHKKDESESSDDTQDDAFRFSTPTPPSGVSN